MVNNTNESKCESNQSPQNGHSLLEKIIWSASVPIVLSLITTLITYQCQRIHERPDIEILGAMPVHLYGSLQGPDKIKFPIHKLAFIFKVENSSPTSAILQMAMIEGCTPLSPMEAEMSLPSKDRLPSGTNINVFQERHKNTIQRISTTAAIHQNSKAIPGYSVSYMGAVFSLPNQGASMSVRGSVSLKGECKEIRVSNSNPAVSQLLKIGGMQNFPKDITPEFRDGRLKLTLFIGSHKITAMLHKIKPLISLSLKRWNELSFPQMYENPNPSYPPKR